MPFTVGQYLTANDLKSQEDAHTLGYGVVNGLKVVPTDPASMDVQVETGKAYVADTLVEKGAVTDLTVTAADPTNPRKDIVVCDSAGTLSIVAGTAGAALPSGNVGVYTLNPEPESIPADSIILAEIWVPAGATEITGSEIYDKRVFIADFIGHKGDASAHHAKYTDTEAQSTVKANVEVGDLKAPTKALPMNAQKITGLGAPTAANDAVRADANLRAPDSSALEGSNKATVQDHTPKAHTLASHSTKAHSELTGVGTSDHHTKYTHPTTGTCPQSPKAHTLASHSTKAHTELTDVTPSQHHAKTTLFTDLTDRWILAQAHRGADGKIMVFKGPGANPIEEDKPAGIPSGVIAMWHGTIANIPSGFVICDGNNSTPNLLARFVQGVATAGTNPGATGGEATHTLSASEMPSHTHVGRSGSSTGYNWDVRIGSRKGTTNTSEPTTSTGGGSAHQNEPPFYDVAFIMKT